MISVAILSITFATPRGDRIPEAGTLSFPHGIPPVLGATSGIQAEGEEFNTISIGGSGTASLQADEAKVTIGVQTQNESASEAIELNAELMSNIIEAVKGLGIDEENMKTVSYSVYPVYAERDYSKVEAYRVVNMVAVKVTDMDLIGKVIDQAAENGANQIQGVSFGLSEEKQEELKEQAYLAALDDAEGKAELIAGRLDLNITGVLYVSESTYQPYREYTLEVYDMALVPAPKASTPIIEGELSVSVTVHVVYAFS